MSTGRQRDLIPCNNEIDFVRSAFYAVECKPLNRDTWGLGKSVLIKQMSVLSEVIFVKLLNKWDLNEVSLLSDCPY